MKKLWTQFGRNQSGAAMMMFAAALPAALVTTGAAIDGARAAVTHSRLQMAADAAALAAVSAPDRTRAISLGDAFAKANFEVTSSVRIGTPDVSEVNVGSGMSDGVQVKLTAEIDTWVMQVFGIKNIPISAVSTAARAAPNAEIAFVLDNTNSMNWNGNFEKGKQALKDVIDGALAGSNASVSIVPMTDRVNLGDHARPWLASAPDSRKWQGCLEPREESVGRNPFALTDMPPTSGLPFKASYRGETGGLSGYRDSYPNCNTEVTVATGDAEVAKRALDDMKVAGTGRFDEGLVWAFRMLSPDWRGQWGVAGYPVDYGVKRKQVVIATDGHTVAYDWELRPGKDCSANGGNREDEDDENDRDYDEDDANGNGWGQRRGNGNGQGDANGLGNGNGNADAYGLRDRDADALDDGRACGVADPEFGSNNGSELGFENLLQICEEMKKNGIEIYFLHLLGNAKAEPFFRQCASGDAMYFQVQNVDQFVAAASRIGGDVNVPRLVK